MYEGCSLRMIWTSIAEKKLLYREFRCITHKKASNTEKNTIKTIVDLIRFVALP